MDEQLKKYINKAKRILNSSACDIKILPRELPWIAIKKFLKKL